MQNAGINWDLLKELNEIMHLPPPNLFFSSFASAKPGNGGRGEAKISCYIDLTEVTWVLGTCHTLLTETEGEPAVHRTQHC